MVEAKRSVGGSEIKFVLDAAQGERVRAWVRRHLEPDPHGGGAYADQYLTTTLYLDTPGFDVYHRRGSNGRAKYRIRRYGESDTIFLERKLRTSNALIKRRSQVPLADLRHFSDPGAHEWEGSWLQRRIAARGLSPACQVSYCRTARGIPTPTGPARLTVDESLLVGPLDAMSFGGRPSVPFFDGRVIVEMKFRAVLPAIFKSLIEDLTLGQGRVSKYRLGMTAIGRVAGEGAMAPVAEAR